MDTLPRRDVEDDGEPHRVFLDPCVSGRNLIIRADHWRHAKRLYDSIFAPGTPLGQYAESLRRQPRDRRP